MDRRRYLAIMVVALAISVSFVSLNSFSQEKGKPARERNVGSETCQACHPEIYDAFKKDSPHWQNMLDPRVPPDKKGCESCHGPGGEHAEAQGMGAFIFSFKDMDAKARASACLRCHQKQQEFFEFWRGVHRLSAVGCNDCHQIHGTQITRTLLKVNEPNLCFSCHPEVKSKFYLSTRHKVLEGAVQCTDCHTPHNTWNRASLKKWNKFNDDVCFKCHPEKRGPWVFEHEAVRVEGCSICHLPHGSPNRFLLIRKDSRTVCIECHGQRHFNKPKLSCINCHTQIHGSNFSSRFLQ